MIIGTAGHIDHGKTTLVKALTGVDTDRLPEEKARGVSIELGYAFMDVPGQAERIGFIDVPGHERLVHTMLSGATGIDHALLLVAADDGVMPQTREHLAVLSLLGLSRGTVVVTKTDRAEPARVAAVAAEAAALLQGTPLQGALVLPVSATTGEGLQALRERLWAAAAEGAGRSDESQAAFRLAIDRVFTLDGVGTVITGTTHAGHVAVGDELRLVPGDVTVRVRSVHAQNRAVQHAGAGQRCALALAGVDRQQVQRGQWLVSPAAALQTTRIDVRLTLWQAEGKPLRSGTPVHVHAGSAQGLGTVALLEPLQLAPGETGLAQLVLQAPLAAWQGDRIVLRDASASRTLAGGTVLDPFAPVRYRRTPQRLAELQALQQAHGRRTPAGPARRRAARRGPAPFPRRPGPSRARRQGLGPGRAASPPRPASGCCRCWPTSTSASPTSSAPTPRACAAWPCRAWPRRCGASCWPSCRHRSSSPCAAPSCICPNTACACRPAKSAWRRRWARRCRPLVSKVPGCATWRATAVRASR